MGCATRRLEKKASPVHARLVLELDDDGFGGRARDSWATRDLDVERGIAKPGCAAE